VRHSIFPSIDTPTSEQPLRIKVTDAGQQALILRSFVRQAIPMLHNPEGYSRSQRQSLAQALTCALQGDPPNGQEEPSPFPDDCEAPLDEDLENYEPGCLG